MKNLNSSRIIRNKHLLCISSVKPYFHSSHSRKSSIKASIGTQCEKFDYNKEIRNSWDYFKITGVVNETLLKKIVSRPMSPVTATLKQADYVGSSKRKLEGIHKSYDFKYYNNSGLIKTNREMNTRSRINTSYRSISKRKTFKCSRKSKSPELMKCESNASFDYFASKLK